MPPETQSATMTMNEDKVELFLDSNPDFTKRYFERKWGNGTFPNLVKSNHQSVDCTGYNGFGQVDNSEMLFELIQDMQESVHMEAVIFKTLKRIGELIHADRCSLFMYRQRNGTPELATRLFNIHQESVMEECLVSPNCEIVFPLDIGVVGHVAQSKVTMNIEDVGKVGYLMCCPVAVVC